MFSQTKYIYRGVIFILLFFISFSSFSTDDNVITNADVSDDTIATNIDNSSDKIQIDYLTNLIERLFQSPFVDSFVKELKEGEERFDRALELLDSGERESAIAAFKEVESTLSSLLERERELTLKEKGERALRLIVDAGKALEEASFNLVINDDGVPEEGFVYKFSLDETGDYSLSVDDYESLSYRDAVAKAANYLERAKEAYKMQNYDQALNYASVVAKVAELFKDSGIKEIYRVKRGDCLWNIAKKEAIYGDSFYWPLLYRANKVLIKDPDIIEPDDELTVPHLE